MFESEDLIVWGRKGTEICLAARCGKCGGMGRFFSASVESGDCEHCGELGWFGIDPRMPIMAPQGSVAKIAMLSVRYASGVPLFNTQDGCDSELASLHNARDIQHPATAREPEPVGAIDNTEESLGDAESISARLAL